jgi:hypothetical protein
MTTNTKLNIVLFSSIVPMGMAIGFLLLLQDSWYYLIPLSVCCVLTYYLIHKHDRMDNARHH